MQDLSRAVVLAPPVAAPSSRDSLRMSRIFDRLAIGVLAALGIVALLTFRDYGLSWDDYAHSEYGDLLLQFYASGLRDQRALSWVNLYYYGGGFDLLAAVADKFLPLTLFETRRLVGAALGILGLLVTWRIGRRVGGPPAGLIALVVLAACPLYYGHMFMNPKDSPFAVAMAILLLGLVRCFEHYPRLPIATATLAGAGFGLSIGSRIMGAFGAIDALAALALMFSLEYRALGIRQAGARLGHFLLALVPAMVLAYALMAFIWPWSVAAPLNPLHVRAQAADGLLGSGAGRRRGGTGRGLQTYRCVQPPRRLAPRCARGAVAARGHGRAAAGDVQRHSPFRVRVAAVRGARWTGRRVSRRDRCAQVPICADRGGRYPPRRDCRSGRPHDTAASL
jgi:hypothetical protein